MPLLYLLLCRDFDIFRLCQKVVVHKDELWDSADTILYVFDAVNLRHNDLEGEIRSSFCRANTEGLKFEQHNSSSSRRMWISSSRRGQTNWYAVQPSPIRHRD